MYLYNTFIEQILAILELTNKTILSLSLFLYNTNKLQHHMIITHAHTHTYIYIHTYRERERTVLFNDALNTFYLRLYGVRHMVKDHSDSEKGNPLPKHRLLLSINSKGSFICTIPQTG